MHNVINYLLAFVCYGLIIFFSLPTTVGAVGDDGAGIEEDVEENPTTVRRLFTKRRREENTGAANKYAQEGCDVEGVSECLDDAQEHHDHAAAHEAGTTEEVHALFDRVCENIIRTVECYAEHGCCNSFQEQIQVLIKTTEEIPHCNPKCEIQQEL